jgi:hypothetical protein
MTENQRLRELLKEARDLLKTMRGADSFAPHAYDRGDDDASVVELARHIHARIDDALAEPPDTERSPLCPGEGTWSVFAEKVVAERDEARARCEKLRELADMAAAEQGLAQRRMMEAQKERDEARAALADAFRRGAEAMRDQAASLFDGGQNVPGLMRSPEFRDFIRALPIPKDKP